ncbi:hypothetical protein GCM10025751_27540 [Haladaptatus pallidirubidus]|uniref:Uncharacterized protein n=1 Tax=Haladaptatus pallidirubidus TaxID=1008152 RepID=A0AAV3UIJ2_9EURY
MSCQIRSSISSKDSNKDVFLPQISLEICLKQMTNVKAETTVQNDDEGDSTPTKKCYR